MAAAVDREDQPRSWWSDAVFYQVYPRSFADSDGDGVGDLDGLTARLEYLQQLGIDGIWINPVTVSPMADHGYDVANPRDIDPLFGGMAAFERLVTAAHQRGIKVTMDVVPNHTSSQHPWFQAALAAGPGTDARDRYFFRDGRGPDGSLPPNNWESVFGGPAWTRVTEPDGNPGQWYLHLFDAEQPDLNWDNPEVFDDFEKTLRFWLERGVDGFRIDVAHGMAKPAGLPDAADEAKILRHTDDDPRFNRPQVHAIHRDIRAVIDDYPGAVTVGEVWVQDNTRWAEYVRPDELHLGFNFRLTRTEFDAIEIHDAVQNSLAAAAIENATPTWTLANHDVGREVTRYGGGAAGLRRARAMAMVMLALPGAVFLYNGQELGLPDVDLPDEALQDPTWKRSGHTERGRDGCRVPLPWSGDAPPFGFSTCADTWLPIPREWAALTVEMQRADPDSTLSFFRRALELRRARTEFEGSQLDWLDAPDGALIFRRRGGGLMCALNAGRHPTTLPPGELLMASGPLVDGQLPPDTAAWLI
ncbi:glycoside hydrolase family 13 protein [Mycobacterium persicum]|uniref:Alpha-amylase n=1 Tax=Mycobacterium persicum TaxID=1487726 RepID=A0A1X0L5F4_9MYCO|nr:glycoside hydrolase family 13 protein [Mycobacterium persicum]KZS82651.1 alpha-amylase [Mycobacterium persicum]ORB58759.1 alpha-amylase [Mycobacterium persicum]ORB88741.1 alpha-amylase [Mycobacterium persicum]ORB94112.1 alpha-amylase [Mycobacterium persicum]ORC00796.1 alpha-amylase [Mycobacterium persicum]